MVFDGLQTKGIFCVHVELRDDRLIIGRLFLRSSDLLGQRVSLVRSDVSFTESPIYTVVIPADLKSFRDLELPLLEVKPPNGIQTQEETAKG